MMTIFMGERIFSGQEKSEKMRKNIKMSITLRIWPLFSRFRLISNAESDWDV
jgi:hypothetical protein